MQQNQPQPHSTAFHFPLVSHNFQFYSDPDLNFPFRFYTLNKSQNGKYGEIHCQLLTNWLHVLAPLAMPASGCKISRNGT